MSKCCGFIYVDLEDVGNGTLKRSKEKLFEEIKQRPMTTSTWLSISQVLVVILSFILLGSAK
ncbi:hypothetical protein NRIC_27220 [Enterococcus florum]|uniref:Uncharacterized protein n=1 Tax=Enterococcus florum TaxID=2480627 RepID=A0A4P5PER4_9ENTE|nr:hypothetical protein NRIC_27220 [Enterococcus florum]